MNGVPRAASHVARSLGLGAVRPEIEVDSGLLRRAPSLEDLLQDICCGGRAVATVEARVRELRVKQDREQVHRAAHPAPPAPAPARRVFDAWAAYQLHVYAASIIGYAVHARDRRTIA